MLPSSTHAHARLKVTGKGGQWRTITLITGYSVLLLTPVGHQGPRSRSKTPLYSYTLAKSYKPLRTIFVQENNFLPIDSPDFIPLFSLFNQSNFGRDARKIRESYSRKRQHRMWRTYDNHRHWRRGDVPKNREEISICNLFSSKGEITVVQGFLPRTATIFGNVSRKMKNRWKESLHAFERGAPHTKSVLKSCETKSARPERCDCSNRSFGTFVLESSSLDNWDQSSATRTNRACDEEAGTKEEGSLFFSRNIGFAKNVKLSRERGIEKRRRERAKLCRTNSRRGERRKETASKRQEKRKKKPAFRVGTMRMNDDLAMTMNDDNDDTDYNNINNNNTIWYIIIILIINNN